MQTRPDTWPIPIADGWAGAEMRVFTLSNSIITDGPTDQRTNGRTKPLIELRVRNQKNKNGCFSGKDEISEDDQV